LKEKKNLSVCIERMPLENPQAFRGNWVCSRYYHAR
jgi:hypothetical protein